MVYKFPLSGKDYYDTLPEPGHSPGDIWSGFPGFSLFGEQPIRAIIITPACDLANRKVETVTFLPLIPVLAYFGTLAFIPEVLRTLNENIKNTDFLGPVSQISDTLYKIPDDAFTKEVLNRAKHNLENPENQLNLKEKIRLNKIISAIQIIEHCSRPEICKVPIPILKDFFGGEKRLSERLTKICKNADRGDIHFLPSDEQSATYSAVPEHSIVLFRYAMTLPIMILDFAQETPPNDWEKTATTLQHFIPSFKLTSSERPVRLGRLKDVYWSDLLTRYLSMHIRLGSPDFSRDRVESFVADMCVSDKVG